VGRKPVSPSTHLTFTMTNVFNQGHIPFLPLLRASLYFLFLFLFFFLFFLVLCFSSYFLFLYFSSSFSISLPLFLYFSPSPSFSIFHPLFLYLFLYFFLLFSIFIANPTLIYTLTLGLLVVGSRSKTDQSCPHLKLNPNPTSGSKVIFLSLPSFPSS
jgi:hypothetical protein